VSFDCCLVNNPALVEKATRGLAGRWTFIRDPVPMEQIIRAITSAQLRQDVPQFRAGDTLNVSVRVVEGDKERIQHFEGIVISRRGSGANETFTIRKTSNGVGVERIFPLHSPRIAKIEFVKAGAVRRAKLYHLRGLGAKDVRRKTT